MKATQDKTYITVKACASEIIVGGDNTAEILREMKKTKDLTAVVVFPELCLTGATCGDAFTQTALLESVLSALALIVDKSIGNKSVLFVGAPLSFFGKVYNCAVAIHNGKILGIVPKTEPSYPFTSAPLDKREVEILGQSVPFNAQEIFVFSENPKIKIGVEIGSDATLSCPPSNALVKSGATVIVNPSVSKMLPQREKRVEKLLAQNSQNCVYIRAENKCGESTTDCLYDGQNFVFAYGKLLKKSIPFANFSCIETVEVNENIDKSATVIRESESVNIRKNPFLPESDIEEFCLTTLEIQARGLCARLKMLPGVAKAIIGLSGGLDSCLALLVINRAFDIMGEDKKKIIAISMPCFGTSKRTKSNAQKLAECLGVTFREISIKDSVLTHFRDIGHDPSVTDATYENSQARERTQVLMDTANKEGGMVIGTGDLSELALGWATYNGDQMSMYGVNGSIPKTMVREIVKVCAQKSDGELREILLDILTTPVSPELLPPENEEIAQVTEDIIGPYELHDFYIYNMLVNKFSPVKIYELACEVFEGQYKQRFILRCLILFVRRFFSQQFKRSCMPDGVQATEVSLSPRGALALPSDMKNDYWLNPLQQIEKESKFTDEE